MSTILKYENMSYAFNVCLQHQSLNHLSVDCLIGNVSAVASPGTLFLWMFWPSFNSALVDDPHQGTKLSVVISTYLALAVSALTAAAASVLSSPKGKLNLVKMASDVFL